MKEAGEALHLRGHYSGNGKELTYGPGDLEGHRGYDGKYYVLDFARVFPPQSLQGSRDGKRVLFELLRPELVRSFRVPLSSDAFTGKLTPCASYFCRVGNVRPQF